MDDLGGFVADGVLDASQNDAGRIFRVGAEFEGRDRFVIANYDEVSERAASIDADAHGSGILSRVSPVATTLIEARARRRVAGRGTCLRPSASATGRGIRVASAALRRDRFGLLPYGLIA